MIVTRLRLLRSCSASTPVDEQIDELANEVKRVAGNVQKIDREARGKLNAGLKAVEDSVQTLVKAIRE